MFITAIVHLQSLINMRDGRDTWKQVGAEREGCHITCSDQDPQFFRGFPFHNMLL